VSGHELLISLQVLLRNAAAGGNIQLGEAL
jgi:hypothetical protein